MPVYLALPLESYQPLDPSSRSLAHQSYELYLLFLSTNMHLHALWWIGAMAYQMVSNVCAAGANLCKSSSCLFVPSQFPPSHPPRPSQALDPRHSSCGPGALLFVPLS